MTQRFPKVFIKSGVNAMITIFGDFQQFTATFFFTIFGEKMAIFLKAKVTYVTFSS
jgi:hypothetical protein